MQRLNWQSLIWHYKGIIYDTYWDEVSMSKQKGDQSKVEILKKTGTYNPKAEAIADPLFREHEFFDPQDLMQVKYEMLRRVYKDGESIKKTASLFGFSRLSFYRTQEAFHKNGLAGLIMKKRGPKDAHKVSTPVLEFIQRSLEEDKSLESVDLKNLIEDNFGISVHPRTIERALARKKKRKR